MLYGALLLVSAGIIAGVAARLLAHERTRLESAALQAEEGRLRNRAEELSLAVGVVQNEILRELRAIPYEEIDETLRNWERTNPLVRNVFVWRGPGDLLLPDPLLPLTREEEGFLTRYKTLFGGMHGWEERLDGGQADRSVSQQLFRNVGKGNILAESSGWVPWYWENTLCMLGWVQRGERRCGVELEMAALLSELQRAMPLDLPEGRAVAVLDAGGHRILQSGPLDPGDDLRAALSVPVGFMLPHWEVALYTADGRVGASAHKYAVASTLLLIVLFVCLFCAGGMLLLEAQRNRRDALQKTTFVSNVSHELKTPLTTIRMYTDLLRQGRVEDEEKKVRYLSTIASESERLTRLVNNVLDFGRLEQNRKKYQIGRFDLRDVVAETVQSQRLRIGEAGITLTEHFPSEPAMVESDRDAVQQALLNLIDNAIKYAASGKQLLVELARSERVFQIRVCDAGAGIPAAHRRKIFERFYRVDDSITARSQGSGLGLGLSRRMLTDLGGSLTYSPAPSGGACFTITLPRVEVV